MIARPSPARTTRIHIIERSTMYQGRVIRLIREQLEIGGQRLVRETIQHPGAVVIAPMIDRSHLVFVRQYRRAVRRWLIELPAGTLSPKEPRLACARRELREETGWTARRWHKLGQFYAAPGFVSELMTLFLAQDLINGPASPEADELVTPVILSLREALAKIRSGAICDAKTIIGVLLIRQEIG